MRTIPFNIITLEKLKLTGACEDGIKFFKNNFNPDFEVNLDQIDGDYKDFVSWLEKYNCELYIDNKGNLVQMNDNFYNLYFYKYDDENRFVELSNQNRPIYCISYVDKDNCKDIIFSHSNNYIWNVTYKYDDRNNLVEEKYLDGETTKYKYDDRNNCVELIYSVGGKKKYDITYKYDERNNCVERKYSFGDIIKCKYDLRGNCVEEKNKHNDVITYKYRHNSEGNLEEICENGKLIFKINYDYFVSDV